MKSVQVQVPRFMLPFAIFVTIGNIVVLGLNLYSLHTLLNGSVCN